MIDIVQRLGKRKPGVVRPRGIILRFLSRTQRDAIWAAANNPFLRENGLRFAEDLPQAVKQIRAKFWPAIQKARSVRKLAYFVGARAFIRGVELHLQQIEDDQRDVKGNWASRGAVIQSSTSGNWFAEKAIDGNRGLQQLYMGCSSTLNQTNPWWRVALPHIYRVSRVVVTNRNDCCTEQINGAEIRIGNSLENNGNNNPICAVIPAIPAGESYSYSCGGMEGRYVNLIIPGNMKILTLCEVEVFGKGPVLKRSIVKMLFNSRADLTDQTMRENILIQLASALADRGFTNVTLSWFQTPEWVIQKVALKYRDILESSN
ncbi:uncharacterized protein [Sinocyclocheilus grahami]|uniref:uncharacterized protein n=1 Tax=Sinocyclocheilus grahami TaxID=75366 RepID=UPI0007ACC574|nr:PREDICTED: uncharacterized protein LOC107575303 [Sinocyclocheilus grahami]